MKKLLKAMTKFGASDLHIKNGRPPIYRIEGVPIDVKEKPLTTEKILELVRQICSEKHLIELEERGDSDFSYISEEGPRFRCNIFKQSNSVSLAIRKVEENILSISDLQLPKEINQISKLKKGLVLFGGITGSGKSTSIAAIINQINLTRACHILTIEDPIEFVYKEKKAFVNQREVGIDVNNFHDALRSGMRQDPDIISIGEIRDTETIKTALQASETGHLVFATIHASGAAQTISRILDLFPSSEQKSARTSLAFNLQAIFNQQLVKEAVDVKAKRIPAVEMMFMTPRIKELIEKEEDIKIANAIQQDKEYGCESYNQALNRLYNNKLITKKTALKASPKPEELKIAMRGIMINESGGGIY